MSELLKTNFYYNNKDVNKKYIYSCLSNETKKYLPDEEDNQVDKLIYDFIGFYISENPRERANIPDWELKRL